MVNSNYSSEGWAPRALALLRIVAGFMIAIHGAQKLFGFLAAPGSPTPPLMSQIGLGGLIEFFGGLLVMLGLFTRPAAFILSGTMAVAYFQMHAWTAYKAQGLAGGFWPMLNKGELAALYCFVFLYLAAAGGGAWSLDSILRRRR